MRVFNNSGSLKVALTPTASAGASALTVRVSGTLGSTSVSNVTSLTFSGSFLTASSPASNSMIVHYFPAAPIMYLSGFRGSASSSDQNLYIVTGSPGTAFSGSEVFMVSALYMESQYTEITHLAGVAYDGYAIANNWAIISSGGEFSDAGSGTGYVDSHTATKLGGKPYCGKWHVITMFKVGTELGVYLDGGGGLTTANLVSWDYPWITDVSFSIGVSHNGTAPGYFPGFIAAVALKTASFVPQLGPTFAAYHERVRLDGDIKQDSTMNWDHIWSVKQNTPGATWRDAVGNFHLGLVGTLSILTESNPRWA